ncbi:methyltransferase domain-containing protein [Rhodobacteraceae bacterium]|nr:methyltransferase domain-containing protein [Paracoccaceae bacterium]
MSIGPVSQGPNAEEAAYWSTKGRSWIEHEAVQDHLLRPVTDTLLELTQFQPGQRVLDIGCGTGAHALAVAEKVGPSGEVLALDISQPLLERAGQRFAGAGAPVQTYLGDAQVADVPGEFEIATSRFGVMFFADPAVAFANIAGALRSGGRMVFAAWAPVSVNPWWRLPITIAQARLGTPPPNKPNAPGPMGLADVTYLEGQLSGAGFTDFAVTPTTITLGATGGPADMAALSIQVGPAARLIRLFDARQADVAAIEDGLTRAYEDYVDDGAFAMPATLNIIDVRLP